jgi:hypothetical protein
MPFSETDPSQTVATDEAAPRPPQVTGERVRACLSRARELGFQDFNRETRARITTSVPVLERFLSVFFEKSIKQRGIASAEISLQGAVLAASVVCSTVEAGDLELIECQKNLNAASTKATQTPGGYLAWALEAGDPVEFFEPDVAEVLGEIKTDLSRHTCALIMRLALYSPDEPGFGSPFVEPDQA